MKRKKSRHIREPHGETKYLKGPDGQILRYRVTSDPLTAPGPKRAALLARVEADVLARNEVEPVDMYVCGGEIKYADGSRKSGPLTRIRFDENWIVVAIEEVP